MIFKTFGSLVSERYDGNTDCEIIQKKLFVVAARRGVQLRGGRQVSEEGLPSLEGLMELAAPQEPEQMDITASWPATLFQRGCERPESLPIPLPGSNEQY